MLLALASLSLVVAVLPVDLPMVVRLIAAGVAIAAWASSPLAPPSRRTVEEPAPKPKPRLRGDIGLRATPRLSGTDPLDAIWGTQASFPTAPDDVGFDDAHHLVLREEEEEDS
ncbi:MAG: hypothetical protein KC621_04975 [Myxococcales bacterium]|nr:hypothetical protein [Myxococcales bacterium]